LFMNDVMMNNRMPIGTNSLNNGIIKPSSKIE
jgi:hypothetical protein